MQNGVVRADAPAAQIKWKTYKVTSSILKLKGVNSADREAATAIEADFKDYPDGKELCSPDQTHKILRVGAYAQYLAVGQTAIPVCGPCDDNRMHLHGWVEMPNPAGSKSRQDETYIMELKSSNPGKGTDADPPSTTWSGSYTMVNTVSDIGAPGPVLTVSFEATIVLVEQDSTDNFVSMRS
jgi:hypothetical protein